MMMTSSRFILICFLFSLVFILLIHDYGEADASNAPRPPPANCTIQDRKRVIISLKPAFPSWFPCLSALNDSYVTKLFYEDMKAKHPSRLTQLIGKADFVIPLTLQDKEAIEKYAGDKLLFPSNHTRAIVDDKVHFNRFMLKHFPQNIPRIFYLDGVSVENPLDMHYNGSFLTKPRVEFGGRGIKIFPNEQFEKIPANQKGLVMEFLNTTDEYSFHFIAVHGVMISQLLFRQTMNQSAIQRGPLKLPALVPPPYPLDFTVFDRMLDSLHYHGPGQSSFRIGEDGKIKIFEINSRFGGTLFNWGHCAIFNILCF